MTSSSDDRQRCARLFGWAAVNARVTACAEGPNSKPTFPRSRSRSGPAGVCDAELPAELERRPTDNLPIVRYDPKAGHRTLDLMRWGLVPYWAKDIKIGFSTINAMAETIDMKPVFREAFARRRCIVPVDNFYEWKKLGPKRNSPTRFRLRIGP